MNPVTLLSLIAIVSFAAEKGSPSYSAQVASAVKAKHKLIRECYDSARSRKKAKPGTLIAEFGIDPTGRLSTAPKVKSSTLDSPEVERCVLRTILSTRFPKPPEGAATEFAFPFKFAD